MNKTARFVLKTVAAGLAFCAFVVAEERMERLDAIGMIWNKMGS